MAVRTGELYSCAGCSQMRAVASEADAERITAAHRAAVASAWPHQGPLCPSCRAELGSWIGLRAVQRSREVAVR